MEVRVFTPDPLTRMLDVRCDCKPPLTCETILLPWHITRSYRACTQAITRLAEGEIALCTVREAIVTLEDAECLNAGELISPARRSHLIPRGQATAQI